MSIEHREVPGTPEHPAFSAVVTVSNPQKMHFLAGRTPVDEDNNCVAPGDFLAQFRRVMEILDLELRHLGATWEDVVQRRIFTTDVDAFLESLEDESIRSYFNPEKMPASTMIGVTRLADPEFLIEIDLVVVTD